jgi:hypothetical protein
MSDEQSYEDENMHKSRNILLPEPKLHEIMDGDFIHQPIWYIYIFRWRVLRHLASI